VSARRFLDTNILLYSISQAPDEALKRERAIALLDEPDCGLSVQVLQEFYVQATRASRADALPHELAVALIGTWLRFPVQETTMAVMQGALGIRAKHGFSFWDCAILAAARALGCRELCSEDFSHGRVVDGVAIINPFIAGQD
jgi:predicted nucleic acid-binding protein